MVFAAVRVFLIVFALTPVFMSFFMSHRASALPPILAATARGNPVPPDPTVTRAVATSETVSIISHAPCHTASMV